MTQVHVDLQPRWVRWWTDLHKNKHTVVLCRACEKEYTITILFVDADPPNTYAAKVLEHNAAHPAIN